MADRGEIPPVDVAVFADTGWEPSEVYEHLNWLRCQVKNTRIEVVNNGNIYKDSMTSQVRKDNGSFGRGRWGSMPLFVRNRKTGKRGMIRRQCTSEYKVLPIRRFIKREILGLSKGERWPTSPVVEQVFGISIDERQRQRVPAPNEKWVTFDYPLIRMGWARSRAVMWAEENYPGHVFPRSACVGCPFHTDYEWARVKDKGGDEWESVVALDKALRNAEGMKVEVYLHSSLQPIDEIDFRSRDEKSGQQHLFPMLGECEGMCGT